MKYQIKFAGGFFSVEMNPKTAGIDVQVDPTPRDSLPREL